MSGRIQLLKKTCAALMVLSLLTGCASSHILMGQARPAISPDKVKLYFKPPAKYEEIAIIEASSQGAFAFTSQSKMNAAIDRLKPRQPSWVPTTCSCKGLTAK